MLSWSVEAPLVILFTLSLCCIIINIWIKKNKKNKNVGHDGSLCAMAAPLCAKMSYLFLLIASIDLKMKGRSLNAKIAEKCLRL